MKKADLLKIEGMTEEMADEVIKGYSGYIPKSRFDEVNEAKKTLESQIEKLKQSADASEALKKEISELQESNRKSQDEIKKVRVDSAVALALKDAGAKNIKAVLPFLNDLNEISDDGVVKGLSDQIKTLKESDEYSFLFNSVEQPKTDPVQPKGFTPATPKGASTKGGSVTKEQFDKMGYKDRIKLFNEDRELYDSLSKEGE